MRVRCLLASLAAIAAFAASMSLAVAQEHAWPGNRLDQVTLGDADDFASPQFFGTYTPLAVVSGDPLENLRAELAAKHALVSANASRPLPQNVAFSTSMTDSISLDVAYDLDLQGRFNGYDLERPNDFDGLFLSPSTGSAPYAAFSGGGAFVGATIALARDLHLNVGRSALDTGRAGYDAPVFSYLTQMRGLQNRLSPRNSVTSMAGLNWDFASWGGLGLTASNTVEKRGLFGSTNPAALNIADGANTNAMGLSARFGFGSGWVTTVSYSEGITQLDLRASSLSSNSNTLHSRSYGVAVAKHGLFAKNDSLGLAVTRPIQVYYGGLGLTTASGLDDFGNILTGSEHVSLASKTPETDFEMGYVTTFFDGALALQANAAWQQNLAGQPGVNSLAVLSRAKINF